MKYIIAFLTISLAFSCTEKEPSTKAQGLEQVTPVRSVSMYDIVLTDREAALNDPYGLNYHIVKDEEFNYTLNTAINLYGGSFFVSPHSKTEFTGRFRIDIAENEHLILGKDFIETPRSVEEIDPHRFVNGPVNWVSKNTKYEHPIIITTDEDFEVFGKYIFTIEPKCTLEEVPFVIKNRNGKLTIENWGC